MKIREIRAVSVDGEHYSFSVKTALYRCSIQRIAGQNQFRFRCSPIGVGQQIWITRKAENEKIREAVP